MKIMQLFSRKIEGDDLTKFLSCYGLKDLYDTHIFTKHELNLLSTCDKLINMRDILKKYYIPCKARLYLEDINESRAITILRQVLRTHKYILVSAERNANHHKQICYYVKRANHPTISYAQSKVVLDFS
jgi:hypothetical protein